MLVLEIMEDLSTVCTEDTPLEKVYALMRDSGQDTLAVVENRAHRIPIGLITEHIICEHLLGRGRNPRGLTAANVMSTDFHKLERAAEANIAGEQFASDLPILVVDENGELCGILSQMRLRMMAAMRPVPRAPSPKILTPADWANINSHIN